ncbi:hypothetical protein HMPREF1051_0958 [Neisseria sicca VK64]|uniref:Uncharacterized protein n=1 Tax=Neisseria sicca VK64 TaxID=1095748 RepID=I2NUL2_NEISI|nr:hypothetical protein HMPREF1051_0958 [Neisseria sicca VK64]
MHSPKACPQAWAISSAKPAPQSKKGRLKRRKAVQTTFGLFVGRIEINKPAGILNASLHSNPLNQY